MKEETFLRKRCTILNARIAGSRGIIRSLGKSPLAEGLIFLLDVDELFVFAIISKQRSRLLIRNPPSPAGGRRRRTDKYETKTIIK